MKVAIVIESFPKLSETFVVNHIKGLIDQGVDVSVFAFSKLVEDKIHSDIKEYDLSKITKYQPVEPKNKILRVLKAAYLIFRYLYFFPKPIIQSINVFKYGIETIKLHKLYEVITFLGAKEYDIVHCHFGPIAEKIALYQAWGVLNGPLVTSFHGYDVDDVSTIQKTSYKNLKKKGILFVSNSEYTKRRLINLGFDPNRIFVLPVCFDVSFFKKKAYYPRSIFNVLTVGRLVEFKGIEYSIRAIAQVVKEHSIALRYTIIGTGPLYNHLRDLINQLDVADFIVLAGNKTQTEIREIMDESDVFLLTGVQAEDGRAENQGLAIQEAQAMELPVVVCDVGGVSEGIIPGETGFLLPQKNIALIAEKILYLYKHPSERFKFGKAGRKFVEQKYSIPFSTLQLIGQYKSIIGNGCDC